MNSEKRPALVVGVICGLIIAAAGGLVGVLLDGAAGFGLVLVALALGLYTNIVVHELGHLVLALLTRIPVLSVRIFGIVWWSRSGSTPRRRPANAVTVDYSVRKRAMALRMVLITLAGPATNLAVAVIAGPPTFNSTTPGYQRCTWFGVFIAGCWLGITNLVPTRFAGVHSDGRNLLRWTFGAGSQKGELAVARERMTRKAGLDGRLGPEAEHGLDSPDPSIAWYAAARFVMRGKDEPAQDWLDRVAGRIDRLEEIVLNQPDPTTGRGSFTENLVLILGLRYLQYRAGQDIDPTDPELVQLARLGELAYRVGPNSTQARASLAMIWLFQDRPADALALLITVDNCIGSTEAMARAKAVRALAEIELGDVAQAARLARSGAQIDEGQWLVKLAQRAVAKAHSAAAPPEPVS